MNRGEIEEKLSKLQNDINDVRRNSAERTSKNINSIKDLNKKCEVLKENIANDFKLTRLYTQAMSFLNWFNFQKLHSDKLKNEAANKKYSELTKYTKFNTYSEYALRFETDEDNPYDGIKLGVDYATISDFKADTSWFTSAKSSNEVKNIYVDGHKIEIEREKDCESKKVKWEETVSYVKQRPFEFDEDVVIAVYNYLKDIIAKDKEVQKYENGGNK